MKITMKTALFALLGSTSIAHAAGSGNPEGMSVGMIFFLTFCGLVIVFQLIPGLILLGSMLKGLLSLGKSAAAPASAQGEEKR